MTKEHQRTDNKKPSESYNFHYGGSLRDPEKRILKVVDSSSLPLTPKEIASMTKINHSSVRVYLRKLKKRNFVVQPFRGYYASTRSVVTSDPHPPSGVMTPRVHNLRLRVVGVGGGGLVRRWGFGGLCEVVTTIGENEVADVQIDCERGVSLDYVAYKVVVAAVLRELNVNDESPVFVTSYELNHDFGGIRLDGCRSLTLRAFDGSFERFYNKKRRLLRSEVRAVGPTSPEAIYGLLKGGVNTYNIMQGLAMLVNEIRQEREAQKFTNRILYDLLAKFKGQKALEVPK